MRSDAATWKPACPAPTMTTPSDVMIGLPQELLLRLGRPHDQAVEFLGDRYLAAQTAVRPPWRECRIEHLVLVFLDRFQPVEKRLVDINVAGSTLAGAATLGDNTVDSILDSAFHDRVANRYGDQMSFARERNVGYRGSLGLFFSKEAHDCRLGALTTVRHLDRVLGGARGGVLWLQLPAERQSTFLWFTHKQESGGLSLLAADGRRYGNCAGGHVGGQLNGHLV